MPIPKVSETKILEIINQKSRNHKRGKAYHKREHENSPTCVSQIECYSMVANHKPNIDAPRKIHPMHQLNEPIAPRTVQRPWFASP